MKSLFAKCSLIAFAAMLSLPAAVPAADKSAASFAEAEKNRLLVVDFYDRFFNRHELGAADQYIGDVYIQHNPLFADGPEAFTGAFKDAFKKFPQRQNKIIRSAANGDLVYLHVHRTMNPGERGDAIVDIYRVENGKIVEHWDVIQQVPEQAANAHPFF